MAVVVTSVDDQQIIVGENQSRNMHSRLLDCYCSRAAERSAVYIALRKQDVTGGIIFKLLLSTSAHLSDNQVDTVTSEPTHIVSFNQYLPTPTAAVNSVLCVLSLCMFYHTIVVSQKSIVGLARGTVCYMGVTISEGE